MKVTNNGLPTWVNKKYRHLEQQDVCQICGSNEEDVFHALLVCPHAVALRQAMRDHWSLPLEGLIETGPGLAAYACAKQLSGSSGEFIYAFLAYLEHS
jgi:hypothetical protein